MSTTHPVLVIGASGAIGSALAEALAAAGHEVWGTSSSLATSAAIPSVVSQRFVCDLTSDASVAELVSNVGALTEGLAGLVLAGGAVAFGSAAELPGTVLETLMRVNLTGPVMVSSALTPLLRQHPDSFVISLSGKIAELPTAGMAAYSASKSGLLGYASAIGRELRREGIRWIDARPGHTDTGFASRALWGTAPNFGPGLTAGQVAARIVTGLAEGEKDLPSSAF